MSENKLKKLFIFGTLFFLLVLVWITVDTLEQVRSVRTPKLTANVVAGKRIWQSKNCNDCHTILGIGGYFAPELTKVAMRRDPAWLESFLVGPQVAKPGTTMPVQNLTALQANQVVAFFQWVNQVDTNDWPPQPMLSMGGVATVAPKAGEVDLVRQGEAIYASKGCEACHMVNGRGASGPGPDLSRIGSQPYDALPNDPQFLAKWLENPVAQKPDTTMPRIDLSEAEVEALVAYLTNLK